MDRDLFLEAWIGAYGWAWWMLGRRSMDPHLNHAAPCQESMDELAWIRRERDAAALVRWTMRELPAYAELPARDAWRALQRRSRQSYDDLHHRESEGWPALAVLALTTGAA